MMNKLHISVAEVLMDIEKELRDLQLWESDTPSDEALSSVEPFAVDTLTFPQWLQFMFLPRLYFMINEGAPLPQNCGITPMAEHYFSALNLHSLPLIIHLQRVDDLLSNQ